MERSCGYILNTHVSLGNIMLGVAEPCGCNESQQCNRQAQWSGGTCKSLIIHHLTKWYLLSSQNLLRRYAVFYYACTCLQSFATLCETCHYFHCAILWPYTKTLKIVFTKQSLHKGMNAKEFRELIWLILL